jgi:hypothetical protein
VICCCLISLLFLLFARSHRWSRSNFFARSALRRRVRSRLRLPRARARWGCVHEPRAVRA